MSLNIFSRLTWGSNFSPFGIRELIHPIPFVIFHYRIGDQVYGDTTKGCLKQMFDFLMEDMNRVRISDIRYNFVIGRDGNLYEARGWDVAPMLPKVMSDELDNLCLYIGLMGQFGEGSLTDVMTKAKDEFISYGLQQNLIDPEFVQYIY